jgi:hypothetical protein
VATPNKINSNNREKKPPSPGQGRRAGVFRRATEWRLHWGGIVSDNIGLSFLYLMCLIFAIFVLFYFIHAFLEMFHASLVFIFESTHKLLS